MKRISARVAWLGRATVFLVGLAATLALALAVDAKPARAYEVHISITGAGQVTETTSANLVGSGCVTSAANPTGTVGKHCYPGDPDGPYGYGWIVRYEAEAKPGYSFVQWQSDGSGSESVLCDGFFDLPEIPYDGSSCEFRTFNNLQVQAVFADTTNPAMASLTGPSQVVNGSAAFTFSAAADPTFKGFECRVGGFHDWQPCSSGGTENPPTGTWILEVRAVDWSGNRSAASSWNWTVDKTPPETAIASGPSGLVNTSSASFGFSSENGATFECKLDSGAFEPCVSPKSYAGLAEGSRAFQVRAKDGAGNIDTSPASRTWTIDTVAPTGSVVVSDGAAFTANASVGLALSAGDPPPGSGVASMRFSNDGATWSDWQPYAIGKEWTLGGGDGEKTVRAQYRDGAGNVATMQDSITLDTTAPDTAITSGPSGTVKTTTASFAFSPEAGTTFECKLDGSEFEACASPMSYSGLSNGSHTFSVRAKDAAGNVDDSPASRSWKVDTIAPSGSVKINNDAAKTASLNVKLSLSALDSGSGVSQMCVSNTPNCSTWGSFTTSKKWKLSGKKAGTKTVYVKFEDEAGNVSTVYRDAIRYAPKKRR